MSITVTTIDYPVTVVEDTTQVNVTVVPTVQEVTVSEMVFAPMLAGSTGSISGDYVSTLNGLKNSINLIGGGATSVLTSGQNIIISSAGGTTQGITGNVVTDINDITGSIDIIAGNNISIRNLNNQVTISSDISGYVSSLNSISGAATLVAGAGIAISGSGATLTISSTGSYSSVAYDALSKLTAAVVSVTSADYSIPVSGSNRWHEVVYMLGATTAFTLPSISEVNDGEIYAVINKNTISGGVNSISEIRVGGANPSDKIRINGNVKNSIALLPGNYLVVRKQATEWVAVSHYLDTDWVYVGPCLVTASTVNPTKPTTTVLDKMYARRLGDTLQVRYHYSQQSTAGATAGSGAYIYAVPWGKSADVNKISTLGSYTPATDLVIAHQVANGSLIHYSGQYWHSMTVCLATATEMVAMWGTGTTKAIIGVSNYRYTDFANYSYCFTANIPIQYW